MKTVQNHVFFIKTYHGYYRTICISRVSCQKGPTRHAYAWQIGPFWQDIPRYGILQQSRGAHFILFLQSIDQAEWP